MVQSISNSHQNNAVEILVVESLLELRWGFGGHMLAIYGANAIVEIQFFRKYSSNHLPFVCSTGNLQTERKILKLAANLYFLLFFLSQFCVSSVVLLPSCLS
eukprot:TRINITY_DN57630_c0_g1_i14.p1 TRINITY_DN57630_c0_g1~~TRINITY_DN57630_c0_g1_i14.p1  ORF type:complete len:102 (-),score=9.74 TRINITY_DN57630_c0_g1_i14:460-765(-)